MSASDRPVIQLPAEAGQAIWRIFGDGACPFKQPTCRDLIEPAIRKQLGETPEADQAVAEIREWFDPDGDSNDLRQEWREPVARLIIDGIRMALASADGIGNHESAFWAMGSIKLDELASIVSSSWSPEEIDEFAGYALRTLETLNGRRSIVNPQQVFGTNISGARAHPGESGLSDPLRTFHVGRDTGYQSYRLMYPGIASVVHLLVELRPGIVSELVDKIQNPLLQSFATFCVADRSGTADGRLPLRWIADTSSQALLALAILHTLEHVRESEIASGTSATFDIGQAGDPATKSGLIADLVSGLAALGTAKGTWWLFELLNHTSFGPADKRPMVELVDQLCTAALKQKALHHWSGELANELRSGLRRARFEPRGRPLANIAWEIRDEQPETAARISQMLLDEHQHRMNEALKDASQFPYLAGRWKYQDWLTALAIAVVICRWEIDPTDWVTQKCKALPLQAWDADEGWKDFHAADRVAQIQMTVGLYAVQLLAQAGRSVDPGKVRAFAEQVWAHVSFVGRYSDGPLEDLGAAELAARIAAIFGEPDRKWIFKQASNPAVEPRTLLALLDQTKMRQDPTLDDEAFEEMRKIAYRRFINPVSVNPQSAPYLADLWMLLDAPAEAAKTAEILLHYHPFQNRNASYGDRGHAVPALKMLAFAQSKGQATDDMVAVSVALYDSLWGQYTTPYEEQARQEIDLLMGQSVREKNICLGAGERFGDHQVGGGTDR